MGYEFGISPTEQLERRHGAVMGAISDEIGTLSDEPRPRVTPHVRRTVNLAIDKIAHEQGISHPEALLVLAETILLHPKRGE